MVWGRLDHSHLFSRWDNGGTKGSENLCNVAELLSGWTWLQTQVVFSQSSCSSEHCLWLTYLLLRQKLLIYYNSPWWKAKTEYVGAEEMGMSDTRFLCLFRSIWANCILHSQPRESPNQLPWEKWALALACHCAAWPASPLLRVSGSCCHVRTWMRYQTVGPGRRPQEHQKNLDDTIQKCRRVNSLWGEIWPEESKGQVGGGQINPITLFCPINDSEA